MSKLEIASRSDSLRLRCPQGHQITPTNEHWYCRQCANSWDDEINPEYEKAVDEKTGEEYSRDEVELDFSVAGVYHA
jgi:hypothetical protein